MTEREFAVDVVRRLVQSGYQALFAGGCVRDELLGLPPADYDVATSATPEQVSATFKRTVEVGASFGVVTVIGPRIPDGSHHQVQVATFRSDGNYSDGRRPDSVVYSSPEEDAQRRDFTINGLFLNPLTQEVIDYVGGRTDLQREVLRAIGDPHDRFREDKLRLLRAVRMAARFGFRIDSTTAQAIQEMARQITVVSAERILEELHKMLVHPTRWTALRALQEFHLLDQFLPEVQPDRIEMIRYLPTESSFATVMALLLGQQTRKAVSGICRRLKMSNEEQASIEWLVEHRDDLRQASQLPKSRLYPLLVQPRIRDLLAMERATCQASSRADREVCYCEQLLASTPREILNPPPLLTGDDLIAAGWVAGPLFKKVLDTVRAEQLDGSISTSTDAMQIANRLRDSSPDRRG